MRKLRTAAALVGAVIITTLGLAYPANAATGTGKVVTAIADVSCGTATVSIVLADGVTGVYNARYYIGGDEAGRVASTGTTKATKTVTFPEDSHGGMADLWVSVVDGPESDYRPKTIAAKVRTDCKDPAKPTVTATGPTCADRLMKVTVTNPNTLAKDKVQVRVGFTEPRWLAAGESVVKSVRGPVKVWAGSPLVPLTLVRYVRPSGCVSPSPTPSASPTAGPSPSASASASPTGGVHTPTTPPVSVPSWSPAAGDGGSDDQGGGGLPVTGAALTGIGVAGLAMLAAGSAAVVAVRRRRQRFTA